MKYIEMKAILKKLNKKWEFDFVSATLGDCCNSCGKMMTEKATQEWIEAETCLVVNWFFRGMNYYGKFETMETLYMNYELPEGLDIETVCSDLEHALIGHYTVKVPLDKTEAIELNKKENVALQKRKLKWIKGKSDYDGTNRYSFEDRDPLYSIKDIQVVIFQKEEDMFVGSDKKYMFYYSVINDLVNGANGRDSQLGKFFTLKQAKEETEELFWEYVTGLKK